MLYDDEESEETIEEMKERMQSTHYKIMAAIALLMQTVKKLPFFDKDSLDLELTKMCSKQVEGAHYIKLILKASTKEF